VKKLKPVLLVLLALVVVLVGGPQFPHQAGGAPPGRAADRVRAFAPEGGRGAAQRVASNIEGLRLTNPSDFPEPMPRSTCGR
jgi:hypothetical protein